jgi:hypothetical protein
MKILKETLVERIRNRLNPPHAVKIIAGLQRAAFREEIAYMAAKEASELVAHYRREARTAIRCYRLWQNRGCVRAMLQPTVDQEGRTLLADARAKASLYIDALRDYRDLIELSVSHYHSKTPQH